MTEQTKSYFVYNKITGELRSLSSVDPTPYLQIAEGTFEVTDEYLDLYQDFISSKKKFTSYKIDVDSSTLKIVDKFAIELDSDYNSFYEIPFIKTKSVNSFEVSLTIISINDIPHLQFKYNGIKKDLLDKKESSVTVYATKKNDINILYETFKFSFEELNDDNELIKQINKLDFDLLFKTNFSFYTRKIFKTYGCAVE
jgi:hypothetical protein